MCSGAVHKSFRNKHLSGAWRQPWIPRPDRCAARPSSGQATLAEQWQTLGRTIESMRRKKKQAEEEEEKKKKKNKRRKSKR
jgi:hypothetical protein